MLKSLRLKFASSIKPLNVPEEMQWKRWLKPPSYETRQFDFRETSVIKLNYFEEWLECVPVEERKISLTQTYILQRRAFDKLLKVQPTKNKPFALTQAKSHRLFFNLIHGKISENIFLAREKPAIVFPVFNSRIQGISASTRAIAIEEHVPESRSYTALIKSFIIIENLVPEYTTEIHPDLFLSKIYLSNYPLNVKEVLFAFDDEAPLIQKARTDAFMLEDFTASGNLLVTGSETTFLDSRIISRYFFGHTSVSEQLISIPPAIYNISLLDKVSITSTTHKLKNLIIAPEEAITKDYPLRKLSLSTPVRILRPEPKGLTIRSGGFRGYPVTQFDKSSISKNLLNTNINDFLNISGSLNDLEVNNLSGETILFSKDMVHKLPGTDIKSEDPHSFPALTVPPKDDRKSLRDMYGFLYEFQAQGVDHLMNNSFSMLSDEACLGKTIQAVTALKLLIVKKRTIKSALIICNTPDVGCRRDNEFELSSDGWLGHLSTWAPELSTVDLTTGQKNRAKAWNIPAHVYLITYSDLLSDEAEEIITLNRLKQFDCIILDNYQSFRLTSYQRERIFNKLKLRFLWLLDNTPVDQFEKSTISFFVERTTGFSGNNAPKEENSYSLRRLHSDVKSQAPEKTSRNKWFKLGESQRRAYNVIIEQGQLKLHTSIETGNLFIIRPQIFTLLHELLQVLNFPSDGKISAKAEFLLDEVKRIADKGQKAVIFTQYEKFGLKKLEELLKSRKIGFVTFRSGMNDQALEQVCQSFRNKTDVTVFLSDVKAVNKNLNLGDFSYILHFDHWWNPLTIWAAEDRVAFTNKLNIDVQYYFTQKTIEESIYRKLSSKGLLNRLIVETVAPAVYADMITTEEWIGLFEMKAKPEDMSLEPAADFEALHSALRQYDKHKLDEAVGSFLVRTGFSKIRDFKQEIIEGTRLIEASKAFGGKTENILLQINYASVVKENSINEFLGILESNKSLCRGIIITSGSFAEGSGKFSVMKNNLLTLIDSGLLTKYLIQLKLV